MEHFVEAWRAFISTVINGDYQLALDSLYGQAEGVWQNAPLVVGITATFGALFFLYTLIQTLRVGSYRRHYRKLWAEHEKLKETASSQDFKIETQGIATQRHQLDLEEIRKEREEQLAAHEQKVATLTEANEALRAELELVETRVEGRKISDSRRELELQRDKLELETKLRDALEEIRQLTATPAAAPEFPDLRRETFPATDVYRALTPSVDTAGILHNVEDAESRLRDALTFASRRGLSDLATPLIDVRTKLSAIRTLAAAENS